MMTGFKASKSTIFLKEFLDENIDGYTMTGNVYATQICIGTDCTLIQVYAVAVV